MTVARQHYGLTLVVLAAAGLSFALLQTMVAPALPAIQAEYGASTPAVTWVTRLGSRRRAGTRRTSDTAM